MEDIEAVEALSALGQESRLRVFRLLMQAGPQGLPAGDIARRLALPPSTLSTHLAQLEAAGLLAAQRDGRTIRYGARLDGIGALIAYLTRDCCNGNPRLCGALVDSLELRAPA